MNSGTIDMLTLVFAAVAAGGSLIRVAQNERSYRLMKKLYRKRKKK